MSFANGLKTIVVATDLDGRSEAALEYARKLASGYGARIVLAHGLDPLDYASVAGVPGRVLTSLPEEARAVLDQMAADLIREGIHSHSEIRQGAVAEMLLNVARQYDAGLIVVGTEGRQGAGPVVVGAVAEQLVRMAPCPVLAVAADYNAGAFRPVPGGPVMLAMEKNEATAAAVATAFLNPGATTPAQLGLQASGRFPVRYVVKDGKPADAMAEAIEQYHPGVLVVGVKRSSETPGPHGTAFTLLARSRVPVLCVPPEAASTATEVEASVPASAS